MRSLDWDNPWIVLCKVQIQALRGQFLDCLRAHPLTTNVVHVSVQSFAHVQYVGLCMLAGEWHIVRLSRSRQKKPSYLEKGRKQGIIIIKQGDDRLSIRCLCCTFPSSALYTSPSTIDF